MSARLKIEIKDMMKNGLPGVEDVEVDESNIFRWTAVVVPTEEPFNKGRFKIELEFPSDYPFKPPKVKFLTPIYHPNVDETGSNICLAMITPDAWKPATRAKNVIEELVRIINHPELDHPIRGELAEQYKTDRAAFDKAVIEHIKKYAK